MNRGHRQDVGLLLEEPKLSGVPHGCGQSIAASVLYRVTTFHDRECLIANLMKSGLESVPAQLPCLRRGRRGRQVWGGMEEEVPAVFVVYKLLHEA